MEGQPYEEIRLISQRILWLTLTAFEADSFQLVTMFHPNRPLVRWSRVANRLATTYGCSYEVEVVIAKPRFLVTAAIAETGYRVELVNKITWIWWHHKRLTITGSAIGHWLPVRIDGSALPLYLVLALGHTNSTLETVIFKTTNSHVIWTECVGQKQRRKATLIK